MAIKSYYFTCVVYVSFLMLARESNGFQILGLIARGIHSKSLSLTRLDASKEEGRRDFLCSSAFLLGTFGIANNPGRALGIMTDETSSFANTNADSAWSPKNLGTSSDNSNSNSITSTTLSPTPVQNEAKQATDEVEINIPLSKMMSSPLGIEVGDVEFRTLTRVYVKSVAPSSLAAQLGIQKNWIFVSVNGQSLERTNAKGVKQIISQVIQSSTTNNLKLVFRDNSFQDQLQSLSTNNEVITQVAPSGDTTQRNQDGSIRGGFSETSQEDQKMVVSQLIPPKMCRRGATTDDLMEISYIGRIADTGEIFDGSAVMINGKGIPGRGNDVSLFFVLGKQPFGQFPPGWDVGLEGMCVGERRRVLIPPVLAYGSTGIPRRNIPPDATLQYDISLISINGLATPQ